MIRPCRLALALVPLLALGAFAQPIPAAKPAQPEVEKALEAFKESKLADAVELLKKAGKANPNLPPPKVQLAQWFLLAGNGQNARVMIEQAIADDNRHPEPYILNANVSFKEGRITDAILNLQMALGLSTDTRWDAEQKKRFAKEARTGLIHSFETRGDFPSAREYATELLNADPKDGAVRARLAEVIFRLDKPAESEKEFAQAFADDPKLDPPELQLAALWQARANAETDIPKQIALLGKVEDWLKKAVANHSKNPKCFREYAVWLLHEGKTDAAGLYIDALGKLDSTSKDAIFTKGLYLLHKKDFAGAEPLFETIYKEAPSDMNAIAHLALTLAETGDDKKKKRAVELAESLVRQNSKVALPYSVLGWCCFKAGRTDEAEKALNTAASVGQINFDTAYFLAVQLANKQKFEEAQKLLAGATSAVHGPFLYRAEAKALLVEVAKKVPEKKPEDKKGP